MLYATHSPMVEPDDTDLMKRIAMKDRAAFVALFERYATRVKAFLMKGGVPHDQADDIAQDVMISTWRKAESFDPAKATVATWIFAIARNRRIDLIRRQSRPEPDPLDPLFQPDPEPDGVSVVAGQEVQDAMRAGLAALNEDQRVVLRAAFYEGLSHGEIAIKLDLPLGTVKSRIRLAFKNLRGHVGEDMLKALMDE